MAGEWLKFDCSLPEKPEVLAITVALGWDDPDLTVGKLMRLFRWFDQQTVDGNAAGVTAALLDRIVGVTGFVQCVADVGWVVIGDGFLSLQNFERHNGATAKGRAQTAKRVANHKANAKGNAPSVTEALPREEKRREEEEQEEAPTSGKPKTKTTTLTAYLARCEAEDVDAIPEDDPVWAWAESVGLPREFVQLAWAWLKGRYGPGGDRAGKRYADWRAVFRNAVKDGWPKFWAIGGDGAYFLTTQGKQAQRVAP